MPVAALFVPDGDRFVPTELTQGPWSPDHQFGGAPAALVAHVVEGIPALVPMRVARLTIDLMHPVPIGPLRAESEIRREGKRVQLLEVSLWAEGREVVRATALRLRIGDLSSVVSTLPARPPRPSPPAVPVRAHRSLVSQLAAPGMSGAIEYAYEDPDAMWSGPTWVRLRVPVVAGRALGPLERMAYVADCASGFGQALSAPVSGINADLTLSVVRYGGTDWLCLDGRGWTGPEGVGVAVAAISDESGVVGTVALSRLVDPVA